MEVRTCTADVWQQYYLQDNNVTVYSFEKESTSCLAAGSDTCPTAYLLCSLKKKAQRGK